MAVKLGEIFGVSPEVFLDEYTEFCKPGYGQKIRSIRNAYGASQVKFAEISGFNRTIISIWESEIYGHHPRRQAYQRLKALAEAKGVNLNDA